MKSLLLRKDECLVAPGTPNALVARLIERCGFGAVYLSGAAVTNTLTALPDVGLLTLTEMVQQVRYVAQAVKIPVIVDADTGFGGPMAVMRTVKELEWAGAAAIQIEDQQDPKRCGHLEGIRLISKSAMVQKIRAAVKARSSKELLIIARTDARGVEGFAAAVDRAHEYLSAGADIIFPEALESAKEFSAFAKQVSAPLMANMTEFGKTPHLAVKEFEAMGYRIAIFPMTALRAMMKAAEEALLKLKQSGTQEDLLSRMQTRQELYDLIDYQDYERIEKELSEDPLPKRPRHPRSRRPR